MEENLAQSRTAAAVAFAIGHMLGGRGAIKPYGENGPAYAYVVNTDGSLCLAPVDKPAAPDFCSGTVKVNDSDSFIEATNRFADPDCSVVYGSMDPAKLVAVLDDHARGDPDWRKHRVELTLQHSNEFKAWMQHNRQPKAQEDFAFFIEDAMHDFVSPTGARMLEIAVNFKVKQGVVFKSALRMSDGTVDFAYENAVQAGAGGNGSIKIPETFKISIPVFAGLGEKKYEFEARFRYQLKEGALALRYELIRPMKVVEQAFKDTIDKVREGVKKLPILFGTPE